jgi:protein-S-isoprenylcysteine O-methyltransferase Ste14
MGTILILKIAVFILASTGLIYVSRSSLHLPPTHGLPRFFAWETILVLFLLNVDNWFRDLLSIHQIISWLFLVISLALIGLGVWCFRVLGKPSPSRDGAALLGIEKTTTLVTSGIYHYIRHPFYSSLLFLAWGIFLKALSWPGFILVIMASICLEFTAAIEEREDINYFGEAYREYIKKTKKFIPFLY